MPHHRKTKSCLSSTYFADLKENEKKNANLMESTAFVDSKNRLMCNSSENFLLTFESAKKEFEAAETPKWLADPAYHTNPSVRGASNRDLRFSVPGIGRASLGVVAGFEKDRNDFKVRKVHFWD